MMKMMRFLVICTLLLAGICACNQEDVADFDEALCSLNFPKYRYQGSIYRYDSLQFSSVFSGGKDTADLYIQIRLSGPISDQDREYKLRVNPDETSGVVLNTHYMLETTQVFRAGRNIDSTLLRIDVNAVKRDDVKGRLYIELVPNDFFVRGLDFYQYMIVNISGAGLSSQPAFWDSNGLDSYAGNYSAIKAEKFIQLNGILIEKWKAPNKAVLYGYAKKTYEWFQNNPTYENGELVVFKGTIEY